MKSAAMRHLGFLLGALLLSAAWTLHSGRDVNVDQLTYHIYGAYQFLGHRESIDFMAAGVQGYINPLGYVPFYLLVMAGWHSLVIALAMACVHSLALWLAYLILDRLLPAGLRWRNLALVLGLLLTFLNPLYLQEVGSSFLDVVTAIPVLYGVLLLLADPAANRPTRIFVAGVLTGLAIGLKPTNGIFGLGSILLVVSPGLPWRKLAGHLAALASGGVLGTCLGAGPWAWRLDAEYGNPLFPFYNTVFKSADFPLQTIFSNRFEPDSLSDYLLFPYHLLFSHRHATSEALVADARYLVFFALLAVLALLAAVRWPSRDRQQGGSRFPVLTAYFLLTYGLWLLTSANGRYAMPAGLLLGPLLCAAWVAVSTSVRSLVYGVLGTTLLQTALLAPLAGELRWSRLPWDDKWLAIEVPPPLSEAGHLYLTLRETPMAFLAPYLPAESAFVNLVGHHSLAPGRPGSLRLQNLLARYEGKVRTLTPAGGLDPAASLREQDRQVGLFGLRVVPGDCQIVRTSAVQANGGIRIASEAAAESDVQTSNDYLSCALKRGASDPAELSRRKRVEAAFDSVEEQCPRRLSPARPVAVAAGSAFHRVYSNSETLLLNSGELVFFRELWRPAASLRLGDVDGLAQGRIRLDCQALEARWSDRLDDALP
jgi:Glycosyltransferase family 87